MIHVFTKVSNFIFKGSKINFKHHIYIAIVISSVI